MSNEDRAREDRELAARRREAHVRALEEEREGYVRQGKTDRVDQVDAEIKRVKALGKVPGTQNTRAPKAPPAPPAS